jgi:tRNA1Val (adenine37-N6)-methyltransferase
MKIGTDAVILGAWASIEHNPASVLDIGAGTGVIALMVAQRSMAPIVDAIEIEENAYEQCVENFENSPWNDRLFCYHASLLEFTNEIEDRYDLIVSNPPFHSEDPKSGLESRDLARFENALPFDHLVDGAIKLLSEDGKFVIIIPYKEESRFIKLASVMNLYPNRILRIKGSPTVEIKRSLIELSFSETNIKINELIIETERHQYTKAYIDLTKDFYLKM